MLARASTCVRRLATAADAPLARTALYDLHVEMGGKMVPFAGYSLPVQFPDGVLTSHLRTREAGKAALFDVGHMGQLIWRGADRAAFLERVCVADVAELKVRGACARAACARLQAARNFFQRQPLPAALRPLRSPASPS